MLKILHAFIFLTGLFFSCHLYAATAPDEAIKLLKAGQSVRLIVEYDDTAIEQTAINMRKTTQSHVDDDRILTYKLNQYKSLKDKVDAAAAYPDIKHITSYSHLPMSYKQFNSLAGLNKLLAQSGVKAVYIDKKLYRVLAQSLPLINQPAVASAGEQGSGTTVAVIDDGIDYTNAAFGPCTAPNVPASTCRVVVLNTIATSPSTNNTHGTNVSAIVLGVAPLSKIVMLNVFDTTGSASASSIITAINWAIGNKSAYNIVSINMSLGDGSNYSSPCSNDWSTSPVAKAKNAGISVVVAAGNSAYTNGLSSPACAPSAISVGAVYDSNIGGVTWATTPNCTDSTTKADQVTCFSNSASYLSLLAPGAMITAAGITEAGTSQASPHIAGAVAVLRSTFALETLDQTLSRMTSTGVSVTDSRNSITKPRINLLEAARPSNDAFANQSTINGLSGGTTGLSLLASKQSGEPNHANNTGGHSVWFKWVAPSAGQLSLDTHSSNFDTLLGVYTGSSVSTLTQIASNDNDGSSGNTSGLLLEAVANQEYEIAVDGLNGAAGSVALNWSLNTSAIANLSMTLSGPSTVSLGVPYTYTMTLSNAGPQTATNVVATASLPAGATYVSGDSSCSANANVVTCNVGTLASSSSASINFQVIWNSIATSSSISASVVSDLPYSTAANNSATYQIALDTSSSGEAPLPQWAMLLMAIGLISFMLKAKRDSNS